MNPLGYPLKKDSVWLKKQERTGQAKEILAGKNLDQFRSQGMDLYNRYQK